MTSKVILVALFSLACVVVLVSATDSVEEQEREAVNYAMDQAREAFTKALQRRGMNYFADVQRRGQWWDGVKQSANDYWQENKGEIVNSLAGALMNGK